MTGNGYRMLMNAKRGLRIGGGDIVGTHIEIHLGSERMISGRVKNYSQECLTLIADQRLHLVDPSAIRAITITTL